jgi:hypothetical protein
MLLLSDGTVLVQGGGVAKTWYGLTPDATGSYVNGTWAARASMNLEREWYASNILSDGRVFLEGGENSGPGGQANWTNTGEIYDPLADAWTSIANFPRTQFGDDPSELLPDGRVLAGYLSGVQTYIYNPGTNTWSFASNKVHGDRSDEETWVKLPDDSILSYDVFASPDVGPGSAQRYLPASNTWVDAGVVPLPLSGSGVGYELGPAFRLPDGRVFVLGATGHTAFYDPTHNTWAAGPDVPDGLTPGDVPGAEMPNGHVLFAAGPFPVLSSGPTTVFDFDPVTATYTDVTPSDYDLTPRPNIMRMVMLPTGQVLFTDSTDQLAVYTPDGALDPSWKPVIAGVTDHGDGTFTLTGTQLNGISEGANYGDDAEMSTNYPLVRLTGARGQVYYARTYHWTSTGVATGDTPVSTDFTLPAGVPTGHYSLVVVANGIASDPVAFTVPPTGHGIGAVPVSPPLVLPAPGLLVTPPVAPGGVLPSDSDPRSGALPVANATANFLADLPRSAASAAITQGITLALDGWLAPLGLAGGSADWSAEALRSALGAAN